MSRQMVTRTMYVHTSGRFQVSKIDSWKISVFNLGEQLKERHWETVSATYLVYVHRARYN
jgi:hypothetical protein